MPEPAKSEPITPDSVLNPDDPGDDVLRRFRYQMTYAAILSTTMLEAGGNLDELFCELHEDILLKHEDGKFTGCQVKTKNLDLQPFTIDDEAIIKSFTRFIELDQSFPDYFRGFQIVTNTGFAKNPPGKCIKSLITSCKTLDTPTLLKKRSDAIKLVKALAVSCKCSPEKVVGSLARVDLRTFSSLQDIDMKLMNRLRGCPLLEGVSESKIKEVANHMLAKFLKASSLTYDFDACLAYVKGMDPDKEDIAQIILAKRITKTEMTSWMGTQKSTPVVIRLRDRGAITELPAGAGKLLVKMDAGGIDARNIQMMRDFKFSIESHLASWIYKYNLSVANEQYAQITGIVNNLCQEVYDILTVEGGEYGLRMLVRIREKLQDRLRSDRGIFFDCAYEHLLGIVAVLTEECKVWWSEKFEIPNA